MDAIVGEAEADQQGFHAEHLLEIPDDRDRSAHADNDSRLWPLVGKSILRLGQHWRIVGQLDCRRGAMLMEFHRAIGRNLRADVSAETLADCVRVLLPDE